MPGRDLGATRKNSKTQPRERDRLASMAKELLSVSKRIWPPDESSDRVRRVRFGRIGQLFIAS
jgi:hypothetical protein